MRKNLIIVIVLVALFSTIGILIQNYRMKRNPASLQGVVVADSQAAANGPLIEALSFNQYENHAKLAMFSDQNDLCQNWSEMEVTFRSEGLAYSGEPDRVLQRSPCYDGGFQQDWPRDLIEESAVLNKVGVFQERPEAWVIESVTLRGPEGTKVLSGVEIFKRTGRMPLLQQ